MGGSGCLLSDFGGSSSLDDSVGDLETEFDCSVRYLREVDTTTPAANNKDDGATERNPDVKFQNKIGNKMLENSKKDPEYIELANGSTEEYDSRSFQSDPERSGEYAFQQRD